MCIVQLCILYEACGFCRWRLDWDIFSGLWTKICLILALCVCVSNVHHKRGSRSHLCLHDWNRVSVILEYKNWTILDFEIFEQYRLLIYFISWLDELLLVIIQNAYAIPVVINSLIVLRRDFSSSVCCEWKSLYQ